MENIIKNNNGHLSSVSGDKAMEAFRLRLILISLRFRQDTGYDMDRRFKSIKIAQQATGLKTRNIPLVDRSLAGQTGSAAGAMQDRKRVK